MRIADRSTTRNYLNYVNESKNAYSNVMDQIASGHRFEQVSDDPSAATRVLRARMDMNKSETHLNNVESVQGELVMAEDSMTAINDILSQIHSLALKAKSEDKSTVRDIIANEIKVLSDEILTFANAKYGNKYVLGGSNASLTPPFAKDDDGRLAYNNIPVDDIKVHADGSYYYMDGSDEKPIPMDGDVYMDIGLGITMNESQIDGDTGFLVSYSGLDILGFGKDADSGLSNNIFNVIADLEDSIRKGETENIGKFDTQLTGLTDGFRANLADIGSKTNFLDKMQGRLERTVDTYQVRISQLMGVDDVEATTTLAMNDAVLKAVQQMGSRILPVSLMDFLR